MWIICGDLHLTDQARDSYRFGIFDWIKRQQAKRHVAATFLSGDITDSKDRHSATLVNKIVSGLTQLKPPIYIVMGNHDYSRDKTNPFFKFLNHIEGLKFITEPTVIKAQHARAIALIPHCRTQAEFDDAVRNCAGVKPSAFLVHQTFDGAIAETGARLSGLAASPIELLNPPLGVYAGDVHKPQTQGVVTYVGCPYHVRFGDNFDPRSIWVDDNGRHTNLEFNAPRKWALTVRGPENILNNKNLYEEDQVKLTIEVAREDSVEWKAIKQDVLAACKELKLEVHGVKLEVKTTTRHQRITMEGGQSSADIYDKFCSTENLASKIKAMGKEILSDGDKSVL
jgi:DNA repair exonuclease SbcCD nuclease subunit